MSGLLDLLGSLGSCPPPPGSGCAVLCRPATPCPPGCPWPSQQPPFQSIHLIPLLLPCHHPDTLCLPAHTVPSKLSHARPASACHQKTPGRVFSAPSAPETTSQFCSPWEERGHSSSLEQVWGQTLLPRVNPKECCGIFCSTFKPWQPGKLKLREVGKEEMPAGNTLWAAGPRE